MNIPTHMPRLKGFRYPGEIIAYAVWAYHRFALSTADVEDLLARAVWFPAVRRSGHGSIALGNILRNCIRRDQPQPNDKWHLDEVVITIRGKKHWLWRAIDANGDVLDIARANTPKRKGRKAVLPKVDHPARRTMDRDHPLS